jgi:hypothetical protein
VPPGAVVVVVVVVVGGTAVVVLTARSGGRVVVVVGADEPAAGSLVVVVDIVAPGNCGLVGIVGAVVPAVLDCDPVRLLACLGEPLDDDDVDVDVDVDVGAIVDEGAVAMREGSAPVAIDVVGVVVPLVREGLGVVTAGLGAPGSEPGSRARSTRTTTMAKTDVIPIPFCRRPLFIFFISYLNSLGIACHFARSGIS